MNKAVAGACAFISVILAGSVRSGEMPSPTNDLPSDVMALISRRIHCERLSTVPSNSDAIAALRCDAVAHDEAALRQQYSAEPRIIGALDGHWHIIVQRVPVQVGK